MIIAHRGASAHAPENTIAAIQKTLEMGCNAIEIDVQLTKDGQVVVIHDYTVDRTTNGSGYVEEFTLEEIKKLDAGSWFDAKYNRERIPTLDEVLDIVPKGTFVNVEIKNLIHHQGIIEKKVVDIIRKHSRMDDVVISSFDHYILRNLRDYDDEIKIGVLIYANIIEPLSYIEEKGFKAYSIHPTEEYTTGDFVKKCHEMGYKVYVYTINDQKRAKKVKDMGVDGIISNFPRVLQGE